MTDKGDDFNPHLMRYHEGTIDSYTHRIKQRCETEKEAQFQAVRRIPFWQANMSFDAVETLMRQDIFERTVREYSLVDEAWAYDGKPFKMYKEVLNPYIKRLSGEVYEKGLSFVFFGSNESGKTFSGCHILASAIEQGMSGYYITFQELMQLHNDAAYGDETTLDKQHYKFVKHCDMLVIDEVGKESKTSDNVLSVFENILKLRSSSRLPTILISNIPFPHTYDEGKRKGGFQAKYGYSLYNLLIERYRVFQFSKHGNFRQKTRCSWFE